MACPEGRTKDGFETQFGVNHLAHFLLFQLLRKTLLTSASPTLSSRVVSVASLGKNSPFWPGKASPLLWSEEGKSGSALFVLLKVLLRNFQQRLTKCLSFVEVLSVLLAGHRSSPILFDDLDLRKQGYDKWIAYGQSKTANIYLANEVERRYGSQGQHHFSERELHIISFDTHSSECYTSQIYIITLKGFLQACMPPPCTQEASRLI